MILNLLQLSSPALPLGAYSYSEGLETLVETQIITDSQTLLQWLIQDLKFGAIRLESAIMVRAYRCVMESDFNQFIYWNQNCSFIITSYRPHPFWYAKLIYPTLLKIL